MLFNNAPTAICIDELLKSSSWFRPMMTGIQVKETVERRSSLGPANNQFTDDDDDGFASGQIKSEEDTCQKERGERERGRKRERLLLMQAADAPLLPPSTELELFSMLPPVL
jgi:hypothetical protein